MRSSELAVFVLLLFVSPSAPATPPETLSGVVRDQSGAVMANVGVELRGSRLHRDIQTDLSGRFTFENLDPGEYDLVVRAQGFRAEHRKVSLHLGESVRLTISLTLESLAQQVTVAEGAADLASLNVTQTQIGSE